MTEWPQEKEHLKEILDQSSMRNRTLLIAFLFLLLYICITVGVTTDLQLFLHNGKVTLPLLDTPIPLFGFYLIAPVILWAVHFNLFFNLKRHRKKLNDWFQSESNKDEIWLLPFLLNYPGKLRNDNLDNILLRVSLSILIFVSPPGVLLFIQIRFSAYQSNWITSFHFVVFLLDILIVIRYWNDIFPQYHKNENAVNKFKSQLKNGFLRLLIILIVGGSALNFLGTFRIIFFPHVLQDWVNNENSPIFPAKVVETILKPHLELQGEELVKKVPENWGNCEGNINFVVGYDFQNRSLNFANFEYADLAKADLRNARLHGANLVNACLRETNLEKAILRGADLSQAELQGVNLSRANLQEANLFKAIMQGANLSRANLQEANLSQAELQGANLFRAIMQGANLSRAELQEAYLGSAELQEANFSRADLHGADLWEAKMQGTNLSEAELQEANLSRAELQGADLKSADLQGAVLRSADLQGTNLVRAKLQGADLGSADLQEANLFRAELQGAYLRSADLQVVDLTEAELQGADLSEAELQGAYLRSADLQGADLSQAELQEADLSEAELQGADLKSADLQGADLFRAKLQGADLFRAKLQGADLRGSDLQGADLSEAEMQGANLFMAELQGANLFMAELQGAYLRRAELQGANLKEAKLQGVILINSYLKGTLFDDVEGLEKIVVDDIDWGTGINEQELRELFDEDNLRELSQDETYQERIRKHGKDYRRNINIAIIRIEKAINIESLEKYFQSNLYIEALNLYKFLKKFPRESNSNPEGALEVRKELVCSENKYVVESILRQDFEQVALKEHVKKCPREG